MYVSSTLLYFFPSTNAPEKPIEGTLLALAMLVASGRLVPRFLQRQCPTVSDSLLIASILDAIGLFVTDYLTYTWGGMSDDVPEPSVARVIALKKVNRQLGSMDQTEQLTLIGTIRWKCVLRHRYLLAKAGHPRAILQAHSANDAVVAKSTLCGNLVYRYCHDIDVLS